MNDIGNAAKDMIEQAPWGMGVVQGGEIVYGNRAFFQALNTPLREGVRAEELGLPGLLASDPESVNTEEKDAPLTHGTSGPGYPQAFNVGFRAMTWEAQPAWQVYLMTPGTGETSESNGVYAPQNRDASSMDTALDAADLYRRVVDSSPVVLWALDLKGRFLVSEGGGLPKLGLSPGEVVGQSVYALYGHNPQIIDEINRAMTGETIISEVLEGDLLYHTQFIPMIGEGGEIQGVVGISQDITSLREAELELAKNRRMLRAVFDAIPYTMAIKDRDGTYQMVNRAWCDTYGVAEAEVLEQHVLNTPRRPAEEIRRVEEEDRRALAEGGLDIDDTRFNHKGELIHIRLIKVPYHTAEGDAAGVVAVGLDQTERIRAEAELQRKNELLDVILNHIPVGLSVVDQNLTIICHNPKHVEMFGLPQQFAGSDIPFESIIRFNAERGEYGKGDPDKQVRERMELVAEFLPHHFQRTRPDGTVLDIKGNPLPGGGFISVTTDITGQKQVEEELSRSKRLLQAVFDTLPHGVTVKDRQSRYLMVNKAMAQIYGMTPEGFAGMRTEDLPLPPDQIQRILDADQEAMHATEDIYTHQWPQEIRGRGTTYWDVVKLPLTEMDGTVVGVVGIQTDVTEFVRLENHLRQHQRMEALGTVARGIAHDFNNILTPILGYADLLMELPDTPDSAKKFIESITNASLRGRDLVSQILLFGRSEESVREPVFLNQVAGEVLDFLRATIPTTITLTRHPPEVLPPVLGDSTQLHQLIMNLCVNASQAMPQGGELEVLLDMQELTNETTFFGEVLHGPHIRLQVRDSGEGIGEEYLSRIFEPFYSTKTDTGNSGLGLATVFGIVRRHQGGLQVQSSPGEGATFIVYLPVMSHAPEQTDIIEQRAVHGTEAVLIVDDEEYIVDMLDIALVNYGYRTAVFLDSQSALESFRQQPESIDLVVTDHTMPGMTGLELAEKMRAIRPELPIILCTGYGEGLTQEKIEEAGITLMIEKPVRPRELAQMVRDLIDRQQKGGGFSPGEPA